MQSRPTGARCSSEPHRSPVPTRFSLATWVADASDAPTNDQWDQSVSEYLALAERYLPFYQPGSTYSFGPSTMPPKAIAGSVRSPALHLPSLYAELGHGWVHEGFF